MTSKVLNLLLLGVVLLTALACSLSDDDATSSTSTVAVSGSIDESTLSKPRFGATLTDLTLYVMNTDGTTQRSVAITGSTFTVDVNEGTNCYLELRFSNDAIYLSKFLSSTETASAITGAPIDSISHYLATEIKTLITTSTNAADVLTAFTNLIVATFGSTANYNATTGMTVLITRVTDSSLQGQLTALANRIANTIITASNVQSQIGDFVSDIANETNDTVTFAAPTLSDSAAPGVVYAFNPGATSSQGELAATPYVVSVTSGAGSVAVDATNSLVKYIPSAADINTTVTLSVNAVGVLGGSNVQTVSITVTDLDITGENVFQLGGSGQGPYSLVDGPLISNGNLYVVANKDGVVTIEKYDLSDFTLGSSLSSPVDAELGTGLDYTFAMPETFSDMIVKNDIAYVVDSNTGVVKYDLNSTSATEYSSVTASNFTASSLAIVGDTLLALNDSLQTFATLDTSNSSADVANALTGGLSDNTLVASEVGSFGSYFYVSGTNTSQISAVEFYNSSLVFVDSYTSASAFEFLEDASGLSSTLYGVSSFTSDVVALSFSGSEIVATTFTNSTAGTAVASDFQINGSYLISNNFSDTTQGWSLTSGNTGTFSADNYTGTDDYIYDLNLGTAIVNVPEGESTLSSAGATSHETHFYVPAKQNTTSQTATYYIKSFKLDAE